MKIRNGFVSNSSSSSFICSVCDEIESGWDASQQDFSMHSCENGHTFHDGCSKIPLDTEEVENIDEEYGELPAKYCPICTFQEVDNDEAIRYLLKKNNLTHKLLISRNQESVCNIQGISRLFERKIK